MPKVRILVPVGGNDFSWTPEQVIEMDEEQAAAWADGQRGERVDEEPPKPPKDGK